ncbi:hypothetical protein [Celeribacter naphthalenivorans]|uniref:hypothetical protein n=1 Tax=Celeribacter naphthalenivorans TaxID=1614694 RepID=UPI001CFBEC99|nr:hypothetical protein [Celeribacter naphthalenivorans]
MLRKSILALTLSLLGAGAVSAGESEGMACYKQKDYLCAFDQLLAHFEGNGGKYMIKSQSGPQTSAKALMESLIRITDASAPGATISRIKAYNAFTTGTLGSQPWMHITGHVLAVEECGKTGDTKCHDAALKTFCSNTENWLSTQFLDRKLNKDFRTRMFAVMKKC